MEIRIVAESELEAAPCEECSSSNVYDEAATSCPSCAAWRIALEAHQIERK